MIPLFFVLGGGGGVQGDFVRGAFCPGGFCPVTINFNRRKCINCQITSFVSGDHLFKYIIAQALYITSLFRAIRCLES